MALNKSDLEAIEVLIQSRQSVNPAPHESRIVKPDINLGDILTKIATAISLALLMWVGTSVSDMQTQQALIVQQQESQKISLQEMRATINEGTRDRFTRQDFNSEITALADQVGRNTLRLDDDAKIMADIRDRVTRLEEK